MEKIPVSSTAPIEFPGKIKNGTKLTLGRGKRDLTITVDYHLNWFQKKMMKWCFGFRAEDWDER